MLLGLLHTISANVNFKSLSEKCNENNYYNTNTGNVMRSYYAAFFRGLCLVAIAILSRSLGHRLQFMNNAGLLAFAYTLIRFVVVINSSNKLPSKLNCQEDKTIDENRGRSKGRKAKGRRNPDPEESNLHESSLVVGDEGSLDNPSSLGEARVQKSDAVSTPLASITTAPALPSAHHSNSTEGQRPTQSVENRQLLQTPASTIANSLSDNELACEVPVKGKKGAVIDTKTNETPESTTSSKNATVVKADDTTSATLKEDDPLLAFLRSQQTCIKGSADEFYDWLVESEDIFTMDSLKEAVQDDDYLDVKMKAGNGVNGIKGYKRGPFRRAVLEHSGLCSKPSNISEDDTTSGPPSELVCPIGLELMIDDPVVACDGVTYERANIEGWFRKQLAKGVGTFLRLLIGYFLLDAN